MFTLTFTKVFDGSGVSKKTGKPYKRWDYKTADETRYVHFVPTAQIPLDVPVNIEFEGENRITSWSVPEGNQQVAQESQNGSEAVRTAPTASQRDFQAEAEGKTRCALVSQLLPAMFTALDSEDQTPEGAQVLLDWAFNYVFQTDPIAF